MNIKNILAKFNPKIWPKKIRIIVLVLLVLGIAFGVYESIANKKSTITYKTSTVTKGTLISSISATGTVTSSNKTSITTGATGTIKTVYVKNGDTVKKGQKIAEVTLNDDGTANKVTAWSNYLTTLQSEKSALADQSSADIAMWRDRQSVLDAQEEYNNMKSGGWNPDTNAEYTYNEKAIVEKTLNLAKETFTADETKYNNYTAYLAKAKQQTATALENYKKVSSTIYAPSAGVISNLSIATGVIISNTSSTITVSTGTNSSENSSTVTSHTVGSITNPDGQYQVTLSLTESDIPKIKAGQKVTMTMDAFEDATFTGEVLAVDVSGTTSSGVTSYSVVVLLDETDKEVYTSMAVTANIITITLPDVLLIPSTAIDTATNGTQTVRVLDNGVTSTVTIETGETNDSETIVTSGLNEGQTIITSSVTSQSLSDDNTSSAFSSSNSSSNSSSKSSSTMMGGMSGGMGGPPGF